MSKITFYGGAGHTTGANFLLEFSNKKVLVDCGMEQGGGEAHERNKKPFEYDVASVDYLFVTHAHIDHIGLIPKLVKEGFRGEIYSTRATKEIAQLLLMDAVKIGVENEESLYSAADVESASHLWKTLEYHKPNDFGGFSLELYDAGHILGSSMFKFVTEKGSMLFSGDIGNSPSPLLPDWEKVSGLDYLLMESVYGDRVHEHRERREERFRQVVAETIDRKGTLLIPAFSLERTQEILSMLDNLFESKAIPSVPVFVDSPLAIKVTAIFEKVKNLYNASAQNELRAGDDLFRFPKLIETARVQDSKQIRNTPGAKIILAGSGMSTAGRILHHEAVYLPDSNSTILFMGFQAAGTLGRQIKDGVKKVVIDDEVVEVKARVENIDGFSGHADSDALVKFVEPSAETLKKAFVAMGEPRSEIFLAQRLRDELEVDAVVAEKGKSYELEL